MKDKKVDKRIVALISDVLVNRLAHCLGNHPGFALDCATATP
jgi:hypothetical protein